MLVIQRKEFRADRQESVLIEVDGKIVAEVLVVKTRSDGVRLGFRAEPEVKFIRSEIYKGAENV